MTDCPTCKLVILPSDTATAELTRLGAGAGKTLLIPVQCSWCLWLLPYAMNRAEYVALHKQQGGKCAVCSQVGDLYPAGPEHRLLPYTLADAGKVSSLLCSACLALIRATNGSSDRLTLVSRYLSGVAGKAK